LAKVWWLPFLGDTVYIISVIVLTKHERMSTRHANSQPYDQYLPNYQHSLYVYLPITQSSTQIHMQVLESESRKSAFQTQICSVLCCHHIWLMCKVLLLHYLGVDKSHWRCTRLMAKFLIQDEHTRPQLLQVNACVDAAVEVAIELVVVC